VKVCFAKERGKQGGEKEKAKNCAKRRVLFLQGTTPRKVEGGFKRAKGKNDRGMGAENKPPSRQ